MTFAFQLTFATSIARVVLLLASKRCQQLLAYLCLHGLLEAQLLQNFRLLLEAGDLIQDGRIMLYALL